MKTDFLKQSLIAHRGFHDSSRGIPENSLAAFERAASAGYIIELDVHILNDDTLVVVHDDELSRLCGEKIRLCRANFADIKDLCILGTDEHIPTFSRVLEFVAGRVPIIIELKYDGRRWALIKEVFKALDGYDGKFAVKSFDPLMILFVRKYRPETVLGRLASDGRGWRMSFIRKFFMKHMFSNIFARPDFISYDIAALPCKRIEKLRNEKMILGWTARTAKELEKAEKYCDNYICENIDSICGTEVKA